jgi:FMN phosphatase YigB (HAD superfamily)
MVQNIIFDLGGVLLNIDYQRTIAAFQELGIKDFEKVYSQANQINLFNDLEIGKIEPSEFYDGIRKLAGINSTDESIKKAWNAMLLDFPIERFEFLNQVALEFNIYLLSNTNQIHLEEFNHIISSQHNGADLKDYFIEVYYSHVIGHRKPSEQAFECIIDAHELKKEETIFIDDSFQHIEGAEKVGIKSYWLDTTTETVIDKLGFLLA